MLLLSVLCHYPDPSVQHSTLVLTFDCLTVSCGLCPADADLFEPNDGLPCCSPWDVVTSLPVMSLAPGPRFEGSSPKTGRDQNTEWLIKRVMW